MFNFQFLDTYFFSPWVSACDHILSYMTPFQTHEPAMRKFIRHPSDIPIDFQVEDEESPVMHRTKDVSLGGLCFESDHPVATGKRIHIHIPDLLQPAARGAQPASNAFDADGVVAWCRREGQNYAVGVRFEDQSIQFGLRMVEQVCHIEHYRYDVLHEQGRELSSEEAAQEWIERFAAKFPA